MGEGRVTRITCRLNLSVIIYLGGFLIGQEAISRRLDSGKMKAEKTENEREKKGGGNDLGGDTAVQWSILISVPLWGK